MTAVIQPTYPLVQRDLVVRKQPLAQQPAAVYVASLSEGSRRTMKYSLDVIAGVLSGGKADAFSLNWSMLRYQHTVAVRSWLMERYQPATVNKMLCALRRTLYHAWKLGQMSAEDSERARDIATLRYETIPAGRTISKVELSELLMICAKDPSPIGIRDAALICTMYGTGIRRASVAKLDLADYNQDTGELRIQAKGRKTIMAYLTGGARVAMSDWLKLRGADPGPIFCRVYKGGKISKVKPETRLSAQAVYDIMRRRSAQCGIAPLTPHDVRRSFVTDLLSQGVDVLTVQKLAGHASPTTTARYDRRIEEIKRKAVATLSIPYMGKLE